MLHYIIQVVAFQLLFLIIYDIFLRKETFFNLNRVYLLSTSILSFVIPFIKIEFIKEVIAKDFVISLPEILIGGSSQAASTIDPQIAMLAGINLEPEPMSIWNIILISGMCIAALILVYKIIKLLLLVSNNPRRWSGNVIIVCLLNSTKAFSFFNYIFLGNRLSEKDSASILEHEMVHIKQKHSLDLLFFELLRIVFWFNPLVYIYQNRIATLHEYIADANAVKGQNKADYYDNLLTQVFETQQFSFVNPFFKHSLIKKRILMLSKSKSQRINLSKYLLIVPLILGMLVYSSCSVFKSKQDKTVETVEIEEVETGEIPFAIVDEVPVYKSCEDLDTNEERKACMSTNIAKHVNKNFNISVADSLGLIGKQRINVVFKIDKKGNVKDVKARAPHPALEKEAKRVIKTLPQLIPGKHKGKAVVVPYSLPIVFMIQGDSKTKKTKSPLSDDRIKGLKEKFKDAEEVPFVALDRAPGTESCVGITSEKESKTCFSNFVSKYVNINFNTDLASKLGLSGKQRINVIFQIDKEGRVTGAKARAPHPDLETETLRVINSLPQFTPGQMNGKAVTANYSLPILFQVADKTNQDKKN